MNLFRGIVGLRDGTTKLITVPFLRFDVGFLCDEISFHLCVTLSHLPMTMYRKLTEHNSTMSVLLFQKRKKKKEERKTTTTKKKNKKERYLSCKLSKSCFGKSSAI